MGGHLSASTTTNPNDSHKSNSPPNSPRNSPPNSPIPTDRDSIPFSANRNAMSSLDPKTLDSNAKSPDSNTLDKQYSTQASDSLVDSQSQQETKGIDRDPDQSKETKNGEEIEGEGEEEEEEGECGFCLFMKGGGCKDSFIAWEKCIEDAEKNKEEIVEKCYEATAALKKCMEAHADYYEPILRAEKAAEEEAIKELEREKAMEREKDAEAAQRNPVSKELEQKVESNAGSTGQ